jgi:hypothetical protein
VDENHLPAP